MEGGGGGQETICQRFSSLVGFFVIYVSTFGKFYRRYDA